MGMLINQNNDKLKDTNKLQLWIAAVMFFSPFVHSNLNNTNLELNDDEKKFLKWYIKLGYINIFLLIISVIFWTISYFVDYQIVTWIYFIFIFALIWFVIIWIFWVVTDINIFWWWKKLFQYKEITSDKTDIILWFIPIYNIFMWYKIHNFDNPYRRIKESIIWRSLFVVLSLITSSAWIGSLILILIIIRVVSLVSWIDLISDESKKKINKIFYKNPEEIRWYVSGFINFVWKKIHLNSKLDRETKISLNDFVNKEKEDYQLIYTFQIEKKLYFQYGILALLLWWQIYKWFGFMDSWIFYVPITMIILRYFVMYLKWKHLPNLPILKEFIDLIYHLIYLLRKK